MAFRTKFNGSYNYNMTFLPFHQLEFARLTDFEWYAFLQKWDPIHTPSLTGVRIGSHLNRNAFMNEQTTIGIHEEEVP